VPVVATENVETSALNTDEEIDDDSVELITVPTVNE
jgi:hypothetical protein